MSKVESVKVDDISDIVEGMKFKIWESENLDGSQIKVELFKTSLFHPFNKHVSYLIILEGDILFIRTGRGWFTIDNDRLNYLSLEQLVENKLESFYNSVLSAPTGFETKVFVCEGVVDELVKIVREELDELGLLEGNEILVQELINDLNNAIDHSSYESFTYSLNNLQINHPKFLKLDMDYVKARLALNSKKINPVLIRLHKILEWVNVSFSKIKEDERKLYEHLDSLE
jgi:hypothetical protein